jgi:hypothetical protein
VTSRDVGHAPFGRNEGADEHEAAALRELRALPDVAEDHAVRELDIFGER